ncbi:hypothetical protein RB195_000896 [Necator americanus]|uniref:GOLD domain-containing protein n=1 Tax=Necator americanus TaxID=51031 RepID=A0ABR1DCP4_NECAM
MFYEFWNLLRFSFLWLVIVRCNVHNKMLCCPHYLNLWVSLVQITLNVQVESGKVECFYVPILKSTYRALELNYRVVKGSAGNRDITLVVRDPRAVEVISDQRLNFHSHRVVIGDFPGSLGDYTLCLDNSYSYENKVVAFAIYLLNEKGEYIGEEATMTQNNALNVAMEVFESSTRHVKSNLNKAESEMNVMRTVSLADRSVAEENFEKVNWYGTVNTCVMIIAAIIQVYLIRSLLTDESSVGKLLRKGRL